VWVQFDPLFLKINHRDTKRDSALLRKKRIIFGQQEALLTRVEWGIDKLK
jgi:hypothetical protein